MVRCLSSPLMNWPERVQFVPSELPKGQAHLGDCGRPQPSCKRVLVTCMLLERCIKASRRCSTLMVSSQLPSTRLLGSYLSQRTLPSCSFIAKNDFHLGESVDFFPLSSSDLSLDVLNLHPSTPGRPFLIRNLDCVFHCCHFV